MGEPNATREEDGRAGFDLPVVDLRRAAAAGEAREAFLRELREAARGFGFFYLTGHGVAGGEALAGGAQRQALASRSGG
ncbi:2-oxoglutarate and iron-dependent oxygenase domain-containing protein [Methylocella sp.]|uniref:2-oxoglutarate and iron-dependent oxygenase domain-containing protein n=1 Tax=Methylocella sp. TaxID=1978226 RepID=UPI0035B44AF3